MREKFQHFMTGRYGADDLSRVYIIATLVIFVISLISGWGILYWIGLALMIYASPCFAQGTRQPLSGILSPRS